MGYVFENEMVEAFNNLYRDGMATCYAWRHRQAKYQGQDADLFVDFKGSFPDLAFECKAVKTGSSSKLYFSQHFSDGQLDSLSEFGFRTGRIVFIAIKLKRGRGKTQEVYLLNLEDVLEAKTRDEKKGICFENLRKGEGLGRDAAEVPFNQDNKPEITEDVLDYIEKYRAIEV